MRRCLTALAAASFPLRQDRPDRGCSPETAREQLPRDEALVLLIEYRELAASPRALAKLPLRPPRFRLDRPRPLECFGVVVSGAHDSMRVPPGWSARALTRPHRTARPRMLFRLANRDRSVVVRVVEHRRGRPSPAFGPAQNPLVFDARRRAGMSFRGSRFSLRIFARPVASARDLEWAEVSARTLRVSAVGRG